DAIKQWIPSVFEENHANELLTLIDEETNPLGIKYHIMNNMVQKLFFVGAQESSKYNDKIVTPWDINQGVSTDIALNKVFQIQSDKLPVTITFNGHQAMHS